MSPKVQRRSMSMSMSLVGLSRCGPCGVTHGGRGGGRASLRRRDRSAADRWANTTRIFLGSRAAGYYDNPSASPSSRTVQKYAVQPHAPNVGGDGRVRAGKRPRWARYSCCRPPPQFLPIVQVISGAISAATPVPRAIRSTTIAPETGPRSARHLMGQDSRLLIRSGLQQGHGYGAASDRNNQGIQPRAVTLPACRFAPTI